MIEIDGSYGEGGGQVLRTSLALSLVTGKPFKITNIRAGRRKPGLMRQHLTAVNAAGVLGNAETEGDKIGSTHLLFSPGPLVSGNHRFSVGTAGSATLVLQAVLPALLMCKDEVELTLEGGTHNPFAPPYDFLTRVFLPVIRQMGPEIETELERPGFYPAGGGKFRIKIKPVNQLAPIDLTDRGKLMGIKAESVISKIKTQVATRELNVIGDIFDLNPEHLKTIGVRNSPGPGNVLYVIMESEYITEVATGFGQRGVKAETVAVRTAEEARRYLDSGAAVGRYLADQLLLPFALAGGGTFTTSEITGHTKTNSEIIKKFLDVNFDVQKMDNRGYRVTVSR